jgi:serine/threonine protein kinase
MATTTQSVATTISSSRHGLAIGHKLDEYTIVRRLSAGGFGMVYLAKNREDQLFAIKEYMPKSLSQRNHENAVTVSSEFDREAFNFGLKSFFEEGRVLASIQHPNIVRVINFFRANQTVYMVMEYADGQPLLKEISSGKIFSERRLRFIFASLVAGLREVHAHRLLHLDIKPANIYIRKDGSPILLDFGAARQTLSRKDRHFIPMYTPGYAAPEQHDRGHTLGPWTDLYALGATMYACIEGKTPVSAGERLKKDTLKPAHKAFRGLYSQELLQLIDQCMSLYVEQRPASLMQVQQSLMHKNHLPPSKNIFHQLNRQFFLFKRWIQRHWKSKGRRI